MKILQTLHISNPLSSLSWLSLLSFFSSQLLSFPGFNSYYLLSRIKFGIRAWLLIVFTIKRSICLRLTLDWSKKKEETKEETLFIFSTSKQPPQTQQIWSRLQRASTPTGNSTSAPVTPRPMAIDSPTGGDSPRRR
jgi:hypothetical protein